MKHSNEPHQNRIGNRSVTRWAMQKITCRPKIVLDIVGININESTQTERDGTAYNISQLSNDGQRLLMRLAVAAQVKCSVRMHIYNSLNSWADIVAGMCVWRTSREIENIFRWSSGSVFLLLLLCVCRCCCCFFYQAITLCKRAGVAVLIIVVCCLLFLFSFGYFVCSVFAPFYSHWLKTENVNDGGDVSTKLDSNIWINIGGKTLAPSMS